MKYQIELSLHATVQNLLYLSTVILDHCYMYVKFIKLRVYFDGALMVQYIAVPVRKNAVSRLQTLGYGVSVHRESDWESTVVYARKKHRKQKQTSGPVIQYGYHLAGLLNAQACLPLRATATL